MNFIEDLQRRGLLDACSDKDKLKEMFNKPQTIYCGFDPSASSLQLGNFIMINLLCRLQKQGHKVIAMLGGATGMIGDPSGKKAERSFLTEEKVLENSKAIEKQLSKYIDTTGPNKGLILNNYSWWGKTDVITFLREFGKNFQIGYMLAKDVVKSRMEVGISYAEFSYMILQSGDFEHVYKNYGCKIQIGGGDQWGNLTSSLDYVKKIEGANCDAQVFSIKLITDSQGKKFGKSESGALYLDPNLTSPYKIYQYFMNVSDEDVLKYLYIFDDRDVEQIDEIYKNHLEHPELRLGQKELAKVIVSKLHSESDAVKSLQMSTALFTDTFTGLSQNDLSQLTDGLVVVNTSEDKNILDALIETKLASSKREAREFVSNSAVKINGNKISSLDKIITKNDCLDGGYIFIKRGKKNYAVLKY